MRIIAGVCRGRILKTVKGLKTRPTMDRIKEAVFSVLAHRIEGAKVLDLFSGTGNIGLEALSRGADQAILVDKSSTAIRVIKDNIALCRFENRAQVLPVDAFKALKLLKERDLKFDLIYLDPPYGLDIIDKVIKGILTEDLLAKKGIIIVENDKNANFSDKYQHLIKVKESIYGDTKISYYQGD